MPTAIESRESDLRDFHQCTIGFEKLAVLRRNSQQKLASDADPKRQPEHGTLF